MSVYVFIVACDAPLTRLYSFPTAYSTDNPSAQLPKNTAVMASEFGSRSNICAGCAFALADVGGGTKQCFFSMEVEVVEGFFSNLAGKYQICGKVWTFVTRYES
jgi:hypothetical protein